MPRGRSSSRRTPIVHSARSTVCALRQSTNALPFVNSLRTPRRPPITQRAPRNTHSCDLVGVHSVCHVNVTNEQTVTTELMDEPAIIQETTYSLLGMYSCVCGRADRTPTAFWMLQHGTGNGRHQVSSHSSFPIVKPLPIRHERM